MLSQRYRTANSKGLVIPYDATATPGKRGYYMTPIITLDFASLYPSIMIAQPVLRS